MFGAGMLMGFGVVAATILPIKCSTKNPTTLMTLSLYNDTGQKTTTITNGNTYDLKINEITTSTGVN
jgi:hypothetical protein